MKKTDLYKNEGSKIGGQMKRQGTPGRFAGDAGAVADKREQRKLDQARGLVPFAVKLPSTLVQALQATASERGVPLNDLVQELLEKSMKS